MYATTIRSLLDRSRPDLGRHRTTGAGWKQRLVLDFCTQYKRRDKLVFFIFFIIIRYLSFYYFFFFGLFFLLFVLFCFFIFSVTRGFVTEMLHKLVRLIA